MTAPPGDQPSHGSRPTLHRTLGLGEVTAGGVGIIIGAGIYVLIGEATAQAGAAVWLGFLLAAVVCALTALSYAELASMFPTAAAEYEYTRQAFPKWLALVVGWVMVAGLVIAAAAVSLGFARYLQQFVEIEHRTAAAGLLAFVVVVALAGIKRSSQLIVVLSTLQVGGLLLIVWIGAPHIGDRDLLQANSAGGVLGAAALVFFAFIGFDEVITLSEETKDPTRTVPRALLAALGISVLLYVAVAIAAVSVLGAGELAASERPLAAVVEHAAGGRGADTVAVLALVATTNTTLLAVTAASRLSYGMARAGGLPRGLAAVGRWTRTPWRAVILAGAAAALLVTSGDVAYIASVTDFAVYVVFLAVNGTVIVLRVRRPESSRPFRTPWAVRRLPVLPALAIASVALMLTQLDGAAILTGLGMTGSFAVVAVLHQWRASARRSADTARASPGEG